MGVPSHYEVEALLPHHHRLLRALLATAPRAAPSVTNGAGPAALSSDRTSADDVAAQKALVSRSVAGVQSDGVAISVAARDHL